MATTTDRRKTNTEQSLHEHDYRLLCYIEDGERIYDPSGLYCPDCGELRAELVGEDIWRVQCACGRKADVLASDLVSGRVRSCGQCEAE